MTTPTKVPRLEVRRRSVLIEDAPDWLHDITLDSIPLTSTELEAAAVLVACMRRGMSFAPSWMSFVELAKSTGPVFEVEDSHPEESPSAAYLAAVEAADE